MPVRILDGINLGLTQDVGLTRAGQGYAILRDPAAGTNALQGRLDVVGGSTGRAFMLLTVMNDGFYRTWLSGDNTLTGLNLGPGNAAPDISIRRTGTAPSAILTIDNASLAGANPAVLNVVGSITQSGTAVALTNDARLSDARTPTSHSHLDADIPAGIARDTEVTTAVGAEATARDAAIATHAGLADPHPGYLTPTEGNAAYQPLNAELTAFTGLVSAADRLPYFTGSNTMSLATFTAAGRALIDDADATAQKVTLGLVIGTNVQAYDGDLQAISGLTSAADRLPYYTGAGTAALATFPTFGRSLAAAATADAARATIGVEARTASGSGITLTATLADVTGATLTAVAGLTYLVIAVFEFSETTNVDTDFQGQIVVDGAPILPMAKMRHEANAFTGTRTHTITTITAVTPTTSANIKLQARKAAAVGVGSASAVLTLVTLA